MHLSIKDPEAQRLARLIAEATGKPMMRVVIEALRSRYDEIERSERRAGIEDLRTIAKRSANLVRTPYAPHGDVLYDEQGLPRQSPPPRPFVSISAQCS